MTASQSTLGLETRTSSTNSNVLYPSSVPSLVKLAAVNLLGKYDNLEVANALIEEEFVAIEKIAELLDKKIQTEDAQTYTANFIQNNSLGIENIDQLIKFIGIGANSVFSGLARETRMILAKVKTLHQLVEENKVEEVDKLLTGIPAHQLPILLKMKSTVVTSARGLKNNITIQGTALMMALGLEAVGREGCDLCLMRAHSRQEDTIQNKLKLYSDDEPLSPFKYLVGGKEFTIKRAILVDDTENSTILKMCEQRWAAKRKKAGMDYFNNKMKTTEVKTTKVETKELSLSAKHFDTLKNMFSNESLYEQDLNLSHPKLNEKQRDAYAALLRITLKNNKHTLFVNEEGMVEVLDRHMIRAFPKGEGEYEVARQTLEQFPDGWEQEEEKQYKKEHPVLVKVVKELTSRNNFARRGNPEFNEFKNIVEPESKNIQKTGRYGKTKLLLDALRLGFEQYFSPNFDKAKSRLDGRHYVHIVGWLERLLPMNYKHDITQGLQFIDLGKKSNRSTLCNSGSEFILSTDSIGLGFNNWIEPYYGLYTDSVSIHSILAMEAGQPNGYKGITMECSMLVFSMLSSEKDRIIKSRIAAAKQLLMPTAPNASQCAADFKNNSATAESTSKECLADFKNNSATAESNSNHYRQSVVTDISLVSQLDDTDQEFESLDELHFHN